MPGLPPEVALGAWERGRDATPGQRGLVLLGLAHPDLAEARRAAFTVGQRDAALLDLFERSFGAVMEAVADCPACSETLELDVPVAAIRVPTPAPDQGVLAWAGDGLAFRLPNAADLAAMPGGSVEAAARWLARRCAPVDGPALGDEAAEALEAALDGAVPRNDPQAVVSLDFGCPACLRLWSARFDIVDFLWRRVADQAFGLLREVHVLASAYGWAEADILALSAPRRRHYLELLGE